MLTVHPDRRHLWSPFLHLQVEAHRSESDSPARSYVRGFFTPRPDLWTAFLLGALLVGTLTFFSVIWAGVQLQLGHPPRALWVTGAAGTAGLLGLIVSLRGKRLAAEQMLVLHATVETALRSVGGITDAVDSAPSQPGPDPVQ